jgi:hypothetical protein
MLPPWDCLINIPASRPRENSSARAVIGSLQDFAIRQAAHIFSQHTNAALSIGLESVHRFDMRFDISSHDFWPISATCSPLYLCLYDGQSPSIMAPSSPTTTAFINYRCALSSVILMHHGKKAALKTPSDECVADCLGRLTWSHCPITVCSV